MKSIYEFLDYKAYINVTLAQRGPGVRTRLANAASCQSGYVTHVLRGGAHFSLEQTQAVADFLGLNEEQASYLILLVSYERAGTVKLKKHFKNEIDSARSHQTVLKNRLKVTDTLSEEDKMIFYSSWHYGAIHVSVSVPGLETEVGLSERYHIPLARVNEVVAFLERTNLIERKNNKLKIRTPQIFINSQSALISKFHTNWRMRAIDSLDRYTEKDLHFSSVITCSRDDALKIREILVAAIEEIRPVVRASKDESCYSYAIDLFEV